MNIPGSKSKGRLWYGPWGDEQDCPTGSRMGTKLLATNTALQQNQRQTKQQLLPSKVPLQSIHVLS